MDRKRKRGSIELSFGVIFAMILIAVFIFVAFFAIKSFLNMQCTVSQAKFVDDLKTEINRMWQNSGAEESSFRGSIGGFCKIEEICFININKVQKGAFSEEYDEFEGTHDEGENAFFYPKKSEEFERGTINHLNLDNLEPNPLCIKFIKGTATVKLKKNSQETLVRIVP